MTNLAPYLDHANHHPDATETQINELAKQVLEYGFNSAFVNQYYLPFLREQWPDLTIGTIVSFPLGQDLLDNKLAAIENCAKAGASELDTSLNVSLLKQAQWHQSLDEMKRMVDLAKSINPQIIIKFIPETGFLTEDEIKKAAELILQSGADFYKTCSGMGPRGAEVRDVELVKQATGDNLKIKVAGGVHTTKEAEAFIKAGAFRIGTSAALEIIGVKTKNQKSDIKNQSE